MDTSNYYYALNNRPSTSSSNSQYYNNQDGYIPNYYPDDGGYGGIDNMPSSAVASAANVVGGNGGGVNNMGNYQRMDQMASKYYEPLFRPPPTSCYAHSYTRHNVEPNPPFITPPPPPQSVPIGWYHHQQSSGAQYEQTLNMIQFSSSNGREARNKAEKNRRDKLNGSIQELSTMVPHVAESPRRVDKTAVLRFSAHGLRIRHVFGKSVNKTPAVKSQVTDSLMRLLDSFLLTVTCRGQIVLISPSIEQHLGHCQTDLFGQNILHITHPDDHGMLKKQLIPTDLETLFDIQPEDENGEPRPRTQEEEEVIDKKLREDRRNFTVRLARAGPRSEPTTYEIVKVDGCFRRADLAPRGIKASTFPSGLQLIRRARGRDDSVPLHSISGNDVILVAMARVIKPPKICDRLIEANHYEYKTRHLIDGRIIQCDQRISLVAGYMIEEVNGLSPFTFMHQDDVRWVIVALRQMYDCNSAYGESCYRLITRTGKFIYLRTRGYLEIDKETNKVHSFVCINTLVNEDEGKQRVQDMKNKFSVIINTKIPPSAIDAPAAENPHQLEKAVIYLIKNLQKFEDDDDDDDGDDISSHGGSHHHDGGGGSSGSECSTSNHRQSKTPPLALIPPKTCTIKSSITKSVNVVNQSVAKSLRAHQQQAKSPSSASASSEGDSRESTDNMNNDNSSNNRNHQCNRPSVVVKKNAATADNDNLNTSKNLENRIPPLPNSKGYFEVNFSCSQQEKSNNSDDLNSLRRVGDSVSGGGGYNTSYSSESMNPTTSAVILKRSRSSDDFDDETNVLVKRRNLGDSEFFMDTPSLEEFTDPSASLTQILSDPFEDIDRSLTADIESVTGECSFDISSSTSRQISEIIEGQQEQREILAHLQNASINPATGIPSIKEGNTKYGLQNSGDFKTR